jgi:hypothetical protein
VKLLDRLRSFRWLPLAGLVLLGGCSLLGDEGGNTRATPPMIGATGPDAPAPNYRQKYRFASEVSNTRKDYLAARRKAAAPKQPAAESMIAGASPMQTSTTTAPQPLSISPGNYPRTGIAGSMVAAGPASSITQRLPDVRQASYGDQQPY